MITIALFKEFGYDNYSGETNKMRYVHSIKTMPREIGIKEREFNYIKIEIVPFIIKLEETVPIDMDKFKSKKNVALVSEALFN